MLFVKELSFCNRFFFFPYQQPSIHATHICSAPDLLTRTVKHRSKKVKKKGGDSEKRKGRVPRLSIQAQRTNLDESTSKVQRTSLNKNLQSEDQGCRLIDLNFQV